MVRVMANNYVALTKWQELLRDLQTLTHLILTVIYHSNIIIL